MKLNQQLLHLVIGGELACVDPGPIVSSRIWKNVDFVGAFGTYEEARAAWKGAAQRTVDNAHMRYFIIHAHKLLEPQTSGK